MRKFFSKLVASVVLTVAICLSAVGPAYAVAGTKVYAVNRYTNVAGAATTLVKSGSGLLFGYCVNTVGTTLVLWDSLTATGTKIASITPTTVGCFIMNAQFFTGLTAVEVGTGDITYLWQ